MPDAGTMTVALTRGAEDCAAWAARLAECGARAFALPCIATQRIDDKATREALAAAVARADWLVFTSRRGVEAFAALNGTTLPATLPIAAVGRATGNAARETLGRIDLIGKAGTAAGLGPELGARLQRARPATVLLALAANAGRELEEALTAQGTKTLRVDVYRTVPAPPQRPRQKLSTLAADAVVFASPTAVTGFCNRVEPDVPARYFSIGPSTSRAVRAAGLEVAGEAREPSLDGLLEIMQCQTRP